MTQFAFKRTGDADYPRHLKILLQGPPKSGKTTFISTAPNVIVAAVEAGLMSIAHLDVPYVEIDGTDKLQTLQMTLKDDSLRAMAAKNLGLPSIDTVAIDTLDAWQEMLKKEIMKENRRTQMQQADWGTLKERMATIMKAFVALPLNVIFTVHTSTSQDDESRIIQNPALQGGIKDEVAGYVDFSLLAFRDRQVDTNGIPHINYYLKNEGDLKNPSLGNRAAGRVPEICEPSFRILHDAVFKGIVRDTPSQNPTEITVEEAKPVAQPVATKGVVVANLPEPEVAAQNLSTPSPQPAAEQAPPTVLPPVQTPATPEPTGTPLSDEGDPINATGLAVLTKNYLAQGLKLPDDVNTWTLGKARTVAKWFGAVKADKAAGQDVPREDTVAYLEAMEAYAGDLPGVQTGVENVPTPPKPPVEPVEEVTTPEPQADATPTPTEDQIESEAIALIEKELGGVQIGHNVEPGAKCEVCGNEVDDLDIANLGLTRFKKVLCVADYKSQGKVSV
jgi:hypothetical protein